MKKHISEFNKNSNFIVNVKSKFGIININGDVIIPVKYQNIIHFYKNLFKVKLKDKWGIFDGTGKEITKCKYYKIYNLINGCAEVQIDDRLGAKCGFINNKGIEIVEPKYTGVNNFNKNDFAYVYLKNKRGVIDKTGGEIIECKYNHIFSYKNGFFNVELNNEYFWINKDGIKIKICKLK